MGSKHVEITVPRKGFSQGKSKIKIEAFGYTGTSCQSVTEAFEKALGSVQEVQAKPEMFEHEQGVERIEEGG
jgi:hypothetical protein